MIRSDIVWLFGAVLILLLTFGQCNTQTKTESAMEETPDYNALVDKYTNVALTADLSALSARQKDMVKLLIEAAQVMDEIFWIQAYGARDTLRVPNDAAQRFVDINYGPWDRLNDNKPFIPGVGEKPLGANFYPLDMTKAEFEQSDLPDKTSLYTMIRRDEQGNLISIPYHQYFKEMTEHAAALLDSASGMAESQAFAQYLRLRADALRTDMYFESDLAWMDMKDNVLDVVIGPIENYEDKLYNYKAAHEAYVLVKDVAWSKRLDKYAQYLPELQRGLPVADRYKQEQSGSNADLNAYDVVYYAGDCNAGSKTIAINLPNDERVQLQKGSRRLQLKNAMQAKFDKILKPIAEELIAEDQRDMVTFDAFFANTMFHEVAHGLGIKTVLGDSITVRRALKEHSSALEEGKADILGLYMVTELHNKGEVEGDIKEYYTTFLAGIFRSIRFGAASAHGQANMVRFNFFKEMEAFERNEETGTYSVNYDKMQDAVAKLSEKLLVIQGDGDYDEAARLLEQSGTISGQLAQDLERLSAANIPVDVVFDQGVEVLGLN
jgi:hypothetical protein